MSIGHSHSHSHEGVPHTHGHHESNVHEYRNYCYLFIVSILSAGAEFLIALFLAHSVSAQADAIHALTHLMLYALALYVSRNVYVRHMSAHDAFHYRDKFVTLYVALVFVGLAWITYTSIIKLMTSDVVATGYMLLSVTIGLTGNIIALKLLNSISKMHTQTGHSHRAHRWINLDAWGDFAFSVIVLITSIAGMMFPSLPVRIIDPLISIAAVIWIGGSGIQMLRTKNL